MILRYLRFKIQDFRWKSEGLDLNSIHHALSSSADRRLRDAEANRQAAISNRKFHPFLLASAARTRSAVKGACGTRTPMALNTALPMAAAVEIVGGSPMPMTPRSGMSI